MQEMRRAPELSATSRSVLIWIMGGSLAVRRLAGARAHDLLDAPALVLGQRPGLHDAHRVALLRALLVVGHEGGREPDGLAVHRVLDQALHRHHDRLGHLGLDHHAHQLVPPADRGLAARLAAHLLPLRRPGQLLHHGLDPRDVPPGLADLERVVELPQRLLEAQPEQLLLQLALLAAQLVRAHLAQLLRFHGYATSASVRFTNLVLMDSLCAASRSAWRASFSGPPSIAYSTRPGLMTATHCSGAPLPLPMRVSCGFLVMGLSGNMRIQMRPLRLMKRVIAMRPGSISRSVTQPHSRALSP